MDDSTIEALKLRLDGVDGMDLGPLEGDLLLRTVGKSDIGLQRVGLVDGVLDARDFSHFLQKVDGNVGIGLEDAGLSHVL